MEENKNVKGKRKTVGGKGAKKAPFAKRNGKASGNFDQAGGRKTKDDKRIGNNKKTGMDEKPEVYQKVESNKKGTGWKKQGEDICPYAKKCGSCTYQGIAYEQQLKAKQELVQKHLGEFMKPAPIIGMERPYHYRNKVHAVFGHVGKGKTVSGVYEMGTHRIVDIENCMIEDEISSAIIKDIHSFLKSFKIKTYDEDTGYGLLRHVMVRRGFTSKEVMVVLVLSSPILPSKNNFVKALRELHPEITTIVLNVNCKKTSMVLGDKETTLYGKGFIEDALCGCTFRISPRSFYQVNPVQTEVLYGKAMEFAGLTGKERVVDAYSGIGTIGIVAASKAKEVICVELNRDAVRDAVINARMNGVKNISFYQKDAGEFLVEMADQGEHVDVVFMDPPRSGSDQKFLESVVKMGPKKVVYVSCSPVSLERDVEYLVKKGYEVRGVQGVDMFPMTGHVETVVLLTRVK